MSKADIWWMENGSDLVDDLTKERDEARAEVDRLRALCARVVELASRKAVAHDHSRKTDFGIRCEGCELRTAIDALGPGGEAK